MVVLALVAAAWSAGLPLAEVSYDVEVTGPLADVVVEQTFTNPHDRPIEATYLFPLHEESAVDEMSITIGSRVIEAEIRDREAARDEYERALAEGRTAALTEQERPNLFTQTVGHISPGEDIVVRLHLVQPVPRSEGVYELVLPLAITPRFVPGGEEADRITPAIATTYGPEGEVATDTGVRADIDVDVQVGIDLATFESPSHALEVVSRSGGGRVQLGEVPMDRDFVLRWSFHADEPRAATLHQDGHLLLVVEPPVAPPREAIVPRELVWVVDASGSMEGEPIALVKQAMAQAFDSMDERDSFDVLHFAEEVQVLAPEPLPATPPNLERGRAYVQTFTASGGTIMFPAIAAALTLPGDPPRKRFVAFLSDGAISNEEYILAAVEDHRGDASVFPVAVGPSPNRHLIEEMARSGRGRPFYIGSQEDPAAAVREMLEVISSPVLVDVEVDWGAWEVDEVYPERIPDLFPGDPLLVVARVHGGSGPVEVSGTLAGRQLAARTPVVEAQPGTAVGVTWARQKVGDLERQQYWGDVPEIREEIVRTALEYRLVTRYTSFVAVDRVVRGVGRPPAEVEMPLQLPAGLELEGFRRPAPGPGTTLDVAIGRQRPWEKTPALVVGAALLGGGGALVWLSSWYRGAADQATTEEELERLRRATNRSLVAGLATGGLGVLTVGYGVLLDGSVGVRGRF